MKFAAPTLLAVFAVVGAGVGVGAGDADVTHSLSITTPHGFPQFAIVAKIDGDGQRVTIAQNPNDPGGSGTTIILDRPEIIEIFGQPKIIEARAYTIGGRKLKPKALRKRLSHNSVVVISTDGHFPSREYLQYLKPRTVVFVFHTGGLFPPQNQRYIRLKLMPGKSEKK